MSAIASILRDTGLRSFEELKAETQRRAERDLAPLAGIDPEDARAALTAITVPKRDAWPRAGVGDGFMAQARAAEGDDPARARALYLRAWHNYNMGRWPSESSDGKRRA